MANPTKNSRPLNMAATLVLLLAWAFMSLVWVINWDVGYNSDVAMIGLMARSIAAGAEFPVYVWTTGYQGILPEAWFAAGLFHLFGSGPLVLSLTATVYTSLFLWVYFLAIRRFFDSPTAWLTLLLTIISCPQFYRQMLRTLPNYGPLHMQNVINN